MNEIQLRAQDIRPESLTGSSGLTDVIATDANFATRFVTAVASSSEATWHA
jgi:hypothetical protein